MYFDIFHFTEFRKGFAVECKFDEKSFSKSKYKKFDEAYSTYPLRVISYKSDGNASSVVVF